MKHYGKSRLEDAKYALRDIERDEEAQPYIDAFVSSAVKFAGDVAVYSASKPMKKRPETRAFYDSYEDLLGFIQSHYQSASPRFPHTKDFADALALELVKDLMRNRRR